MKAQIRTIIQAAINKLQQDDKIEHGLSYIINVDVTKNPEHGDFATNIAMILAKTLRLNPMQLAHMIVEQIASEDLFKQITIASPGFINFYLADRVYHQIIKDVITQQEKFGQSDVGQGQRVLVEYVSANPTGPLHVGHGRGAAFGATIVNLLKAVGFNVHSEYYVNDAGRQMHILALSVWLRYLALTEQLPHFPENGYQGDYVIAIAKKLAAEHGKSLCRNLELLYQELPLDASQGGDKDFYVDSLIARAQSLLGEQAYQVVFAAGIGEVLADIKEDLEEFEVVFDEWFSENHLIKNGDVQKGIAKLQELGCVYTQDNAVWFKATAFGDEKDRVLVRANGQSTYFASDVGYHLNKYERGFDQIIDVLGADHHGYAPRINGFLKAMCLDTNKLNILLVQFAVLYRSGQKVAMSTRSGEFVTLRQLRAEVGKDAARFFYIMRKNDQHLDFDLDLAKSQSADNPVYYIQYAHARICSVMRQVNEKNIAYDVTNAWLWLDKLDTEHEKTLLRTIAKYPIVLQAAALKYEPHLLAYYLKELASDFHAYYNNSQFIVADSELCHARLCLVAAIKQILVNGLTLLGVGAPEVM